MWFLVSPSGECRFSYSQLWSDLRGETVLPSGSDATTKLYVAVVDWLSQILRNEPRVCWDFDSSKQPPEKLQEMSEDFRQMLQENPTTLLGTNIERWRQMFLDSQSRILIETSGSSGTPKQIWHTVQSLTRGIRLSDQHRKAVWGWTYPVDHLAGMQVLFQALLNGNPLVHLYRATSQAIHTAFTSWSISHMSCTPTFLRMLLVDSYVHPSLIRLTTGGERLDEQLSKAIGAMFPNARLTNIYASTEAGPLLVSHSDSFEVPEVLRNKIQIVERELWFHRSLLVGDDQAALCGEGVDCDFWATGDQVEVLSENPLRIRFLSRCHEGFNVAGYRVDPVKLEAIARTHPQVAEARFYGVPNSITEHLVACDLVPADDSTPLNVGDWQAWLRPQVQRHEVPRIVRWVKNIETTASGKVKRQ